MTCCLAVCLPHASLAAADTRVGIEHDGQRTLHDGPAPLTVAVTSLGRTLVYPYRYRKIRKVGHGWAVCAGEFSSATAVLDILKARGAEFFANARASLTSEPSLLKRVAHDTGIGDHQLRETIIIGAPFGSSAKAWTLGLRQGDSRTDRAIGDFAVNWPNEVPPYQRSSAEAGLRQALAPTGPATSPLHYAKALAGLIAVAADYGDTVGEHVQIGMTLRNPDGSRRSMYFEGLSSELRSLTEDEFRSRAEIAA